MCDLAAKCGPPTSVVAKYRPKELVVIPNCGRYPATININQLITQLLTNSLLDICHNEFLLLTSINHNYPRFVVTSKSTPADASAHPNRTTTRAPPDPKCAAPLASAACERWVECHGRRSPSLLGISICIYYSYMHLGRHIISRFFIVFRHK